ncbi:hypothetical protein GC170_13715 [bacterium]|nr:hypothetical protein [bacterium]
MATLSSSQFQFYTTHDIPVQTKLHQGSFQYPYHAAESGPKRLMYLDNSNRVLYGEDREGDQYVITVHGPGEVVVTDVTPNDGVLMDDIDTIQIVGSNPHTTYVTAQVTSSNRVLTDGMVRFQQLIAENGVNSIILNGFALAQTLPINEDNTVVQPGVGVFLPGGVQTLQIADVEAYNDVSGVYATNPVRIVVGDAASPLKKAPIIRVGTIYNTMYSSQADSVPNVPQSTPTVSFEVYGPTHAITTNAITRQMPVAGLESNYPKPGAQGLTSIATTSIGQFQAIGGVNFTRIARNTGTNISPTTALDHAGLIHIGGTADALSVSSNGPIRSLRLMRGLGDPSGTSTATQYYGTTAGQKGFPAYGYMGGQINAGAINRINIGAANTIMQVSNSPQFIQRTQGVTNYFPRAGSAMTNAAITTSGSMGTKPVHTGSINHFGKKIQSNATGVLIRGDLAQSEIASGFDYNQYVTGVSPVTGPSVIRGLRMKGSLVDSVISASYAPDTTTQDFLQATDQVSPGAIHGGIYGPGLAYDDGRGTALGRLGSGLFARRLSNPLHSPPPNQPIRTRAGVDYRGS